MTIATASDAKVIENARLPRWERTAALVLAALILAAKFCYLRALPVNSDEPQHIHVAWGWTQGLVQYRDFFDNHTPLFHLLMAPLVAWLGERADILFWMRVAMLPLYAVSLACVFRLGTALYSRRVAVWATLLGATFPTFLFLSTQFRTDVLWMTAWFASVAVFFTGRMTRGRAFAGGLLLGAAFAVSLKTVLLAASLLAAFGTVVWFLPRPERWKFFARDPGIALAALAGLCVIPLLLLGYFGWEHALPALRKCVLTHNALPLPLGREGVIRRWIVFPSLLPLAALAGWAAFRTEPERSIAVRRALVVLTAAFFLLFLECFWPMVTDQDYLPVVLLVALSLAPLLCARCWGRAGGLIFVGLVAVLLAADARFHKPLRNELVRHEELLSDILRLTNPGDFVMDSKGETVFRQRPFYYVLENVTKMRLETGSIDDTIAGDMRGYRTCVTLLRRIPGKSMEWVQRSYIPVTQRIYVAGCALPPIAGARPRPFEVGIEAAYTVVSANGPVPGAVDGIPCSGPVYLPAGPHTFTGGGGEPLAVIWAQAVQRGFTPFRDDGTPRQ